jgi:outer membrane protein OmpA-like peptidoglycan-associated protein
MFEVRYANYLSMVFLGLFLLLNSQRAHSESEEFSFKFEPGSTIPSYSENVKIVKLANKLNKSSRYQVLIEAHLANSNHYQYELFRKVRALRLYEILTRHGVNPAQISFKDLGPIDPISSSESNLKARTVVARISAGSRDISPPRLASGNGPALEKGKSLSIFFSMGGHTLSATNIKELKSFAAANEGDKITILGATDKVGSALTNLLLSRLRALTVYRSLVEMGWPAANVTLANASVDRRQVSWREAKVQSADQRRVDLVPALSNNPPSNTSPVDNTDNKESVANENIPDSEASLLRDYELGVGGGFMLGLGDLGSHTKPGLAYTIKVQREFSAESSIHKWMPGSGRMNLDLSHGRVTEKDSDLEGFIQITSLTIGLEHVFMNSKRLSPYFGEFLGWGIWRGEVKHKPSARERKDSGSTPVVGLKAGVDIMLTSALTLLPEVRFAKFFGEFNESLLESYVSLAYGF